jgi:hypothetical protein
MYAYRTFTPSPQGLLFTFLVAGLGLASVDLPRSGLIVYINYKA